MGDGLDCTVLRLKRKAPSPADVNRWWREARNRCYASSSLAAVPAVGVQRSSRLIDAPHCPNAAPATPRLPPTVAGVAQGAGRWDEFLVGGGGGAPKHLAHQLNHLHHQHHQQHQQQLSGGLGELLALPPVSGVGSQGSQASSHTAAVMAAMVGVRGQQYAWEDTPSGRVATPAGQGFETPFDGALGSSSAAPWGQQQQQQQRRQLFTQHNAAHEQPYQIQHLNGLSSQHNKHRLQSHQQQGLQQQGLAACIGSISGISGTNGVGGGGGGGRSPLDQQLVGGEWPSASQRIGRHNGTPLSATEPCAGVAGGGGCGIDGLIAGPWGKARQAAPRSQTQQQQQGQQQQQQQRRRQQWGQVPSSALDSLLDEDMVGGCGGGHSALANTISGVKTTMQAAAAASGGEVRPTEGLLSEPARQHPPLLQESFPPIRQHQHRQQPSQQQQWITQERQDEQQQQQLRQLLQGEQHSQEQQQQQQLQQLLHGEQHNQQQQQQKAAAAPQRELVQGVLLPNGQLVPGPREPPPLEKAWRTQSLADAMQKQQRQQRGQADRKAQGANKASQAPVARAAATPGAAATETAAAGTASGKKRVRSKKAGAISAGAGGGNSRAGGNVPAAPKSAAASGPDGDGDDDGGPRAGRNVKRARKAAASGSGAVAIAAALVGSSTGSGASGKAARAPAASSGGVAAAAMLPRVLPLADAHFEGSGVVDAVRSRQAFNRLQDSVLVRRLPCCLGLLLSDVPTSTQPHSSLRALSKQQEQAIKQNIKATRGKGAGPTPTGPFAGAPIAIALLVASDPSDAPSTATGATATAGASSNSGSQGGGRDGGAAGGAIGWQHGTCYLLRPHDEDDGGGQEGAEERIGDEGGAVSPDEVMDLVVGLLTKRGPNDQIICANMQGVLRGLLQCGCCLPANALGGAPSRLLDPLVMGWLHEPQLMQRDEQQTLEGGYTVQDLAKRHGLADGGGVTPQQVSYRRGGDVLRVLRQDLAMSALLAGVLSNKLQQWGLPYRVLQTEMRVAAMLAHMESLGLPFDPSPLQAHGGRARSRSSALQRRAAALAGRDFNLGSSSQLATILYKTLGLPPPPAGTSGTKTHLPTDEVALRHLAGATGHALPGVALKYRSLQNFLTKWLQADWVLQAIAEQQRQQQSSQRSGQRRRQQQGEVEEEEVEPVRVHCSWNHAATATGRLSSSGPNLQAVTKYTIDAAALEGDQDDVIQLQQQQEGGGGGGRGNQQRCTAAAAPAINVRDAFVAQDGWVLLASDYSQVELRLLAHLSGDPALVGLLSKEGPSGDVFELMARRIAGGNGGSSSGGCGGGGYGNSGGGSSLPGGMDGGGQGNAPGGGGGGVSGEERERAKRVTYGILYGITAYGLAKGGGGLGCSVAEAQRLISSFLAAFPGVRAFLDRVKIEAVARGEVRTLAGRRRPIPSVASNDQRERAEGERKAVNSTIQGSAADLIKAAMVGYQEWAAHLEEAQWQQQEQNNAAGLQQEEQQHEPPIRLVAQIHDELLFEVDSTRLDPRHAARQISRIMTNVAKLRVPLKVKLSIGDRWGSMQPIEQ